MVARADGTFLRGQPIRIEIWSRNRGGFVLVHSIYDAGQLQTDAHVLASMTACMTHLERLCTQMKSQEPKARTITSLLSDTRFRQRFEILVGEFLCRLTKDEGTSYGESL